MLVADAHQLLSNRPLYVPPSRWYPLLVTFLALVYTAGRVWRDLSVFLLLLANEELPLVAMGDKASPESCRTVCEVAMVGGGEEEEWKEGGGE